MESFLLVYQMAQSNHRALGVPPRASLRLRVTFPYVPQDENVVDELYPYGRHGHGHGRGHGAASGSGVTVTWGSLRLYSEMSGRTAPAFERSMSSLAHRITLWLPARKESNPRSPGPLIYVYLFLSIGPRVELAEAVWFISQYNYGAKQT